jgi:hypothetical protein
MKKVADITTIKITKVNKNDFMLTITATTANRQYNIVLKIMQICDE